MDTREADSVSEKMVQGIYETLKGRTGEHRKRWGGERRRDGKRDVKRGERMREPVGQHDGNTGR